MKTVILAKAGTHNHRQPQSGELLPQVADTFRITSDGVYGSPFAGTTRG